MFLIEGLPAIILGVVVFFTLCDWPRDAKWLTDGERTWLVQTLEGERQV